MKKIGLLNIMFLMSGMTTTALAAPLISEVEARGLMHDRSAYLKRLTERTQEIPAKWKNKFVVGEGSANELHVTKAIRVSKKGGRIPDIYTKDYDLVKSDNLHSWSNTFEVPEVTGQVTEVGLAQAYDLQITALNSNGKKQVTFFDMSILKGSEKSYVGEGNRMYRQITSRAAVSGDRKSSYSLYVDGLAGGLSISWEKAYLFAKPNTTEVVVTQSELNKLLGPNSKILEVKTNINFDQRPRRVSVVYVAHDKSIDSDVIYQKEFAVEPVDAAHPPIDGEQTHRLVDERGSQQILGGRDRVLYFASQNKTEFIKQKNIDLPVNVVPSASSGASGAIPD